MSGRRTVIHSRLAVSLALAAGGCVTFQPLEPRLSPPPQYQMDVTAPVEFIAPLEVGFRCAERGARFLGLPGINSSACADTHLMTLPDPCLTLTAGAYARDLCEELSQLRREAGSAGESIERGLIEVEFVQPSRLSARCAERGIVRIGGDGPAACRAGSVLSVANPCRAVQRSWYTEMLCHEMGHVNGWAADHTGGAVVRQAPLPLARESSQALALANR